MQTLWCNEPILVSHESRVQVKEKILESVEGPKKQCEHGPQRRQRKGKGNDQPERIKIKCHMSICN